MSVLEAVRREEAQEIRTREVTDAKAARRAERAAEALAALPGVTAEYLPLREKWEEMVSELAALTKETVAARRRYVAVWGVAENLGCDVPMRIPASTGMGNDLNVISTHALGC